MRLLGGLALIAVCWSLNWLLDGPRTHLLFFPLWLGYVLAVDGLVERRSGTSILRRSPARFVSLFFVSIPVWWIFEALNLRLNNWRYVGRELFSDLEYAILASIAFSTVVPAVFETAELLRTFRWTERLEGRGRVAPHPVTWFAAGAAMLALVIAFPDRAYPLTWISLLFLADPIAHALRRGSLLDHLGRGDWRTPVTLALGALTCGFFWELWNWHSFPKWVYRTPGAEFWHVFEMPLLGYLGYIPFGLELHSMVHLIAGGEEAS